MKTVDVPIMMSRAGSRPAITVKQALTSLAVLAALAILVSLGVWQLQRKTWKEALIADLGSRAHAAPVSLPARSGWAVWDAARDEFRHIFATGTFLSSREIRVYGLMDDNGRTLQGNFLFTPLALDSGGTVLVNRGFVPRDETAASAPPGPVRIEGILRAPERRGWFVPENAPARGEWFTRDSAAMARALGLADMPLFYVEADANTGAAWPRGGTTRSITLKNDHLQYALTWFGLALVLAGVTGYAMLRH